MSLTYSKMVSLGTEASYFVLPGTDGMSHSLDDYKSDFLVIVFMCNHCPYVLAVIDHLIELSRELREQNVIFVGINANDAENYPEDSFEMMMEYQERWGMQFDYLYDESQEVAMAYEAMPTPDVFVYDKGRKLVYRGRIDDRGQGDTASEDSLKIALDDLVAGREISIEQESSEGCNIKWR
jgi:thiol-disulfide isomerase/thioredoxin